MARYFFGILAAFSVVLTATAAAWAQKNPLVGSWRGVETVTKNSPQVFVDVVMSNDQRFGERIRYGGWRSMNFGQYSLVGNVLKFKIRDWNPKVQCQGGACKKIDKPVDGAYRVKFTSANAMTLKDVKGGGIITFTRQR